MFCKFEREIGREQRAEIASASSTKGCRIIVHNYRRLSYSQDLRDAAALHVNVFSLPTSTSFIGLWLVAVGTAVVLPAPNNEVGLAPNVFELVPNMTIASTNRKNFNARATSRPRLFLGNRRVSKGRDFNTDSSRAQFDNSHTHTHYCERQFFISIISRPMWTSENTLGFDSKKQNALETCICNKSRRISDEFLTSFIKARISLFLFESLCFFESKPFTYMSYIRSVSCIHVFYTSTIVIYHPSATLQALHGTK